MASISRAAGAWIGLSAVRRGAQRLGAFDLADDGPALFHHLQDPGWPERLARQDVGGFGITLGQARGPVRRHRRSEEHTSELQSRENLVCRLLLEKKKNDRKKHVHK